MAIQLSLCFHPAPVNAIAHQRPQRGGSQPHEFLCDDGHRYVVKYANNPQGRRILVNEWIGSTVLEYLGIRTPPVRIVRLDERAVQDSACWLKLGNRRVPPDTGCAFGSRIVSDDRLDFLPGNMLADVRNLSDFGGALVADRWLSNADARQAVFVQEAGGRSAFMVDQGYCFAGPHWTLEDRPTGALYGNRAVYAGIDSADRLERWIAAVERFPMSLLAAAAGEFPHEWLRDGDGADLDSLLFRLELRKRNVRALAGASIEAMTAHRQPYQNRRAIDQAAGAAAL